MPRRIRRPTFFLRSGYFIDSLKLATGLSFEKIEARVRQNQYESSDRSRNIHAPAFETVRDYFRLYRSVAFEPDQHARSAPWLLAAELEFPGCSSAFFHPVFDLLFGELETSVFWASHFRKIPEAWIVQARNRGDIRMADEWELMNQSAENRKHRSRASNNIDKLSFVHLTLLRLPSCIKDAFFDGDGSNQNWTRKYSAAEIEVGHMQSMRNMESIAALLALMMESAEIGDVHRFNLSKEAYLSQIPLVDTHTSCARIKSLLRDLLVQKADELYLREYNNFVHFGFGLPVSWQAMKLEQFLITPPSMMGK